MNLIVKRGHRCQSSKRCTICRLSFSPHPRLGERQVLCGEGKCRKEYLRRYRRSYRARNLNTEQEYQSKRKVTRPADYWRIYRQTHPEYRAREKANARLRKRRAILCIEFSSQHGSQRQLDILQVPESTGESGALWGSQRQLDRASEGVLVDDCVSTNKEAPDGVTANTKEFFLDRPDAYSIGRLGETLRPGAPDFRCTKCHVRP
jgi:hypothetical protein